MHDPQSFGDRRLSHRGNDAGDSIAFSACQVEPNPRDLQGALASLDDNRRDVSLAPILAAGKIRAMVSTRGCGFGLRQRQRKKSPGIVNVPRL
jgi:hypothetical protein